MGGVSRLHTFLRRKRNVTVTFQLTAPSLSPAPPKASASQASKYCLEAFCVDTGLHWFRLETGGLEHGVRM